MTVRDRRELKELGAQALDRASMDPRKLVLVYIGATALLMLAVSVLNILLQSQIAGTGGLGGLGMRTMLETAIQVLQTGTNLVVPFWTLGYMSSMIRIVRGRQVGLTNLLDGFRNFAPALRLLVLRACYYFMPALMSLYTSMIIFEMSPLAKPMMELLEPQMEAIESGAMADLSTVDGEALTIAMLPLCGIFLVLFVAVAAPIFYRFRMADYALLDDPKAGARMALRRSAAMMQGNRMSMLKLDLSFWWFYLLEALTLGICYLDLLLGMVGIQLPFAGEFGWVIFYVLYLAAQVALYYWGRNKLESTYAVAYETLNKDLEQKIQEAVQQAGQQQY